MTARELLAPIVEFLGAHSPFDQIDSSGRFAVARIMQISYHRRGSELQTRGAPVEFVHVIRSGALDELNAEGQLLKREGEGDSINAEQALGGRPSETTIVCHEDSLLYSIPVEHFVVLCEQYPPLADGFSSYPGGRLERASLQPSSFDPPLGATSACVSSLLRRSLVSVDRGATISEAAQLMNRERVSCVLVTGGERLGIVTDRDFRVRVLAAGKSPEDPIASVMSSPVRMIDAKAPIFEALLSMVGADVHHLAVVENDHPVGMITTTDLVRLETENPVYVVSDVRKQTSLAGVVQVVAQRRNRVLERLVNAGARAVDVHRVLTLIGDAVTRKLIRLAEMELPQQGLGPMPAYCWIALGSQARYELNLGSDQDNALILGPGVSPDNDAARWLSETVCEGLAAAGYPRCPGDVMAATAAWRQPLREWQRCFEGWIREPAKMATMQASIFFDLRPIEGDESLAKSLLDAVGPMAREHSIFRAHMGHNALGFRPPLGLFRQFVLEKTGEHKDSLDLKHRGLVPVIGLARLFALEAGYSGANTLERLSVASDSGVVSRDGASDLQSAFEWISLLRLKHQASCLSSGQAPDSFVSPASLSSFERRHLHDAFRVIKTMQDSVRVSRQLGVLG
jgi:CBS domain-containing protein